MSKTFSSEQLAQNYQELIQRVERAAIDAGRDPHEIKLVAVTKYVDVEIVKALVDLGCNRFGESRPQVLWQKAEELKDVPIEWHLIGHLQTNKVRKTLPHFSMMHSGDSLKLLQCVNEEAARIDQTKDMLCEVNISGDEEKHGFTTEQLLSEVDEISQLGNIRIKGLMTMASRAGGVEQASKDFQTMKEFREQLRETVPQNFELDELSMGMSRDFEQAIQYGATMIRVGSVLYEGVQ